jgi:2-oxoglutarate ferredoxin oxidoreductase subunit gamma
MTEKTFMAGFGGQGVVSMGELWVYFAMKEGLEITFFPFYGAEKEIASPLVTCPDSAIAMNEDSLALCENMLKKDGVLIVNSNLVKSAPKRKDLKVVKVPCNEIAEKIGDVKFANMVMLGALSKVTGSVKLANPDAVLKSFFSPSKHKFIPMNISAIEAGRAAV